MVKTFVACAGILALIGTIGVSGATAQTYDTNATSVIASVVNAAQASTVVAAVVGGFTGGGTGGAPGLFGAPQLSSTRTQQKGLSAGGHEKKLAVWVNGAYSTFDENQKAIESDGDVIAIAAGGDWRFSDRFLAGLSVGYETADVTTTFNLGSLDTDGFFVAPYMAYKLNSFLFLDASVGYASLETDAARTSSGAQVTGNYDSNRLFGAANLTGRLDQGKWTLMPGIGVMYTRQKSDEYTESNGSLVPSNTSRLGRLRAGARMQYQLTPKVAPFVRGDVEYDFKRDKITVAATQTQPTTEDTGAVLGAGVILNLTDRIRGTVEGSTVLGRSDFQQYNLTGNLRFSF